MDSLTYSSQSTFIKDRSLQDCVAAAQEVISFHESSAVPLCTLKLDFAKAFDSVDWEFMYSVLRHRGFSSTWVRLISNIFSTSIFSVCTNGVSGRLIASKRGLR